MMLLGCLFFADNLELHFLSHFLVEADCGGVNTDLLYRVLDLDELAVHNVAEFFKGISHLGCAYRTEHSAGGAGLGGNSEFYALDSRGCSLSLLENLGDLVGTLSLNKWILLSTNTYYNPRTHMITSASLTHSHNMIYLNPSRNKPGPLRPDRRRIRISIRV